MKALIFDQTQPNGLRFDEQPIPTPKASEALIETRAISLNGAEVSSLATLSKPGAIPGWDSAGVVVRQADDGSGPSVGTRVSAFGWGGAWAEFRAVETTELGVGPAEMDFAAASTLPVAGVTAFRSVKALGAIAGRRILVTGASGGVGRFAVQLAHLAGASVIASVRGDGKGTGLTELGAEKVIVRLDEIEDTVDGVIETVGGATLAQAMYRLSGGGVIQSVGVASKEPTTIDFTNQRLPNGKRAAGRRIEVFAVGNNMGSDLTYLLSLIERKALSPSIQWHDSWEKIGVAFDALLNRRVAGKLVLDVSR